jgi:hypothetical protein
MLKRVFKTLVLGGPAALLAWLAFSTLFEYRRTDVLLSPADGLVWGRESAIRVSVREEEEGESQRFRIEMRAADGRGLEPRDFLVNRDTWEPDSSAPPRPTRTRARDRGVGTPRGGPDELRPRPRRRDGGGVAVRDLPAAAQGPRPRVAPGPPRRSGVPRHPHGAGARLLPGRRRGLGSRTGRAPAVGPPATSRGSGRE